MTGFYNRDGVCLLRGTKWTERSQVSPSQIYGEQNSDGADWLSLLSFIPPTFRTDFYLHVTRNRRTKCQSLETFPKAKLFLKSGSIRSESCFTLLKLYKKR